MTIMKQKTITMKIRTSGGNTTGRMMNVKTAANKNRMTRMKITMTIIRTITMMAINAKSTTTTMMMIVTITRRTMMSGMVISHKMTSQMNPMITFIFCHDVNLEKGKFFVVFSVSVFFPVVPVSVFFPVVGKTSFVTVAYL